jgi:hypothetical protein
MRGCLVFTVAVIGAAASTASAAPPARGSSAGSGDQRDRVICRRFLRTGSLVDGYRTCKTRAEWDREHENLQHLEVVNSCRIGISCEPQGGPPPH